MAPGYFDTFSRAFVSMFRITIGSVDWWYDIFPIVESDGSINIRASFFLISYVIVVNWYFFQITIAVLLEICQESKRDEDKRRAEVTRMQKQREKALKNPLDPLLLDLSREFVADSDLDAHLQELFSVCYTFCTSTHKSHDILYTEIKLGAQRETYPTIYFIQT
jgi:hypothetical protein